MTAHSEAPELDALDSENRGRAHAQRIFDNDPVANALGVRLVDAGDGRATVSLKLTAGMLNGAGSCHGGVVFMLADIAFQCACNSYGRLTVAAAGSIDFVRPAAAGDELTAACVERYRTRSGGGYDVTVTRTRDGAMIAQFRGRAHELDPRPAARPASGSEFAESCGM